MWIYMISDLLISTNQKCTALFIFKGDRGNIWKNKFDKNIATIVLIIYLPHLFGKTF